MENSLFHSLYKSHRTCLKEIYSLKIRPLISVPGASLSGGRFASLLGTIVPAGSHFNADPPGVYAPSTPIN